MRIAFWCVLIAGLLPYVAVFFAKKARDYDNANPRAWLAKQEGLRARAHAAQLNAFEALPLFAASVIIAHLRGAGQALEWLAVGFVVARVVYLAVYLANRAVLRSLVWFVGLGVTLAMWFVP